MMQNPREQQYLQRMEQLKSREKWDGETAWNEAVALLRMTPEDEPPERTWTEEECLQLRKDIKETLESWKELDVRSELQKFILYRGIRSAEIIFSYRLGLYDGIIHTRLETARAFQVTPERVRQVELKTLQHMIKVQCPPKRRPLSSYLNP